MNSLLAAVVLTALSPSEPTSIQQAIDALPRTGLNAGGEIRLTCGTFMGEAIFLRSDVALVGSGQCTIIPRVTVTDNTVRQYRVRIENLVVDGALDGSQYIGIDLRNVTSARVRNVQILNVQTGVLLYQAALYNSLEDLTIDATTDCFEILDGANENILRGGRCQSASATRTGIGLWVRNADDVKVFGTSFENLNIGIKLDTGAEGTALYSPRLENMNTGVLLKSGSKQTGIFQLYYYANPAGVRLAKDGGVTTPAHYRDYGF